jgi:hypothetical protein
MVDTAVGGPGSPLAAAISSSAPLSVAQAASARAEKPGINHWASLIVFLLFAGVNDPECRRLPGMRRSRGERPIPNLAQARPLDMLGVPQVDENRCGCRERGAR